MKRTLHIEPLETRIAPAFVSGTVNLAGLAGPNGTAFQGAGNGDGAGSTVSAAGDVNGDGLDDFLVGTSALSAADTVYVIFGQQGDFDPSASLDAVASGSGGLQILGGGVGIGAAAAAGDVNGDGFDDLIVGTLNANGKAGAAFVIFGRKEFAAPVPLSALNGDTGFKLSGAAVNDYAGSAVSGAGDVNGDGFDDVLVGAFNADGKGAAYLVFGQASGFAPNLNLATLATQGVKLSGVASGDSAGQSVSGAGDVNGDGLADVIVGAPYANEGGTSRGAAYVVFGKAALSSNITLGALSGQDGFRLKGGADKNYAGQSVSAAGDVNGDGFGDVLVGASGVGNSGSFGTGVGAAYLVLGHSGVFSNVLDLAALAASDGVTFSGVEAGDQAGRAVSGAGDVNADGFADVLIGAAGAGGGNNPGAAYLVFGKSTPGSVNLGALSGADGVKFAGVATNDRAGSAVSLLGDVNGDGYTDLLIGSPVADATGTAYLVRGGPSGLALGGSASFTGNGTINFTDVDGDLVTIKASKPITDITPFKTLLITNNSIDDRRVQILEITLDSSFDGQDLSITAKRANGGDGKVNVGFINAPGVDLGKVVVGGDLGRILAGDPGSDLGVKSLTVGSMGFFGGRTGDTSIGLTSTVTGGIGPVKITGDFREGQFMVVDNAVAPAVGNGSIASITVGGSVGTAGTFAGFLAQSRFGAVTIGGDLYGVLSSNDGLSALKIRGDVIGGEVNNSGAILVKTGTLGSVTIGGDVRGGSGTGTGAISAATIGKVSIAGDLLGGSGFGGGAITGLNGNIGGITIGGDARAGFGSGTIASAGTLGPVVIKGDVVGFEVPGRGFSPFAIIGTGPQAGGKPIGIVSVKIGGDFEHGFIGTLGAAGAVPIGAISVGGDWIGSTASASVVDSAESIARLGNGGDRLLPANAANTVASIQSVTIKGTAIGTFETGDRFAIVAEQIGSVKIGGAKLALTKSAPGTDPANDLAAIHVGPTPDFVVREISRTAPQPGEPDVTLPAAGPRTAQPAALDLDTLASGDGFKVGGVAFDQAGTSVSSAGDVNGDGFDDFIVGANFADGGTVRGAAYVVFGQAGGLSSLNLSALDGSNGFKLSGGADGDTAGNSVAAAGDVNGDGFADVIVGAPFADVTGSESNGAAYLVFGRSSFAGNASISLASLDGFTGLRLNGVASGMSSDEAGTSVSGAGDVNGDGLDDVIVGAPDNNYGSGAAYVVFGRKDWAPAPAAGFAIDLGTLDGTTGFKVENLGGGGGIGTSVSGAGDVNGDGFDDVIFGAPRRGAAGAAYVLFGKSSFASTPSLSTEDLGAGLIEFTAASDGDRAGGAVGAAGDVNGDGFADLIVGDAKAGQGEPGAAYVIFGKASGFAPTQSLSFLNGGNGFALFGDQSNDYAGGSVSGAGDVNGDGFADLIVGAAFANPNSKNAAGTSYVVFGKAAGFATSTVLSALNGANGFAIQGAAENDASGTFVSAAGDVNGDGFADVIVGATRATGAVAFSGAAYVVYGGPSGEFIDPTFSNCGKTATWTDVDGDLVTLKVSTGTLDATNFKLLAKSTADSRAQLLALTLTNTFDRAHVSLTAKRAGGGDGRVNVGFIDAENVDLGVVTVHGDLGRITAGDGENDPGLQSLTLGSLGVFGARTQETGGRLGSFLIGAVGAVKIAGDFRDAQLLVFDATAPGSGKIASVTIGGSLIGGAKNLGLTNAFGLGTVGPGTIGATGGLGSVKILGDLVGGAADFGGQIKTASLVSLTLGGSLIGGTGTGSGAVLGDTLGNVSVAGSLLGGGGASSGTIYGFGKVGKVVIRHDIAGGAGRNSGSIESQNAVLTGVTIGGDARSGTGVRSGALLAGGTLGPVAIGGDVIGTVDVPYLFRGTGPLSGPASLAIASVKVGGDFDHALVLAGYGAGNAPLNGHAQIGAIRIGGDWIASSVTAGIISYPGATAASEFVGTFGNGDDTFISGGPTGVIASIASITIKGRALGSFETGDRFGIVAESIGRATISGVKLALTANADTIAIGPTPDFVVLEVARF